jgi:predicted DCC family thiol-disulfide oxidoreductase YuxK
VGVILVEEARRKLAANSSYSPLIVTSHASYLTQMSTDPANTQAPIVYFDGACPLCRREIALYQRWDRARALRWVDISVATPEALGGDLTLDAARARLHARTAQGNLVSGARAFVLMWRAIPATRWLGWLADRPIALSLLDAAYRGFLRVRPLWAGTRASTTCDKCA